jgi:hypothetical protein
VVLLVYWPFPAVIFALEVDMDVASWKICVVHRRILFLPEAWWKKIIYARFVFLTVKT